VAQVQVEANFLLKSSLNFSLIRFFMIAPNIPRRNSPVSLEEIPEGEDFRVVSLGEATELSTRLREMGFCEDAVIRRVAGGSAIVCQICGTRVALNSSVAGKIRVERFACEL
jgi:ferrous iron transport protein A